MSRFTEFLALALEETTDVSDAMIAAEVAMAMEPIAFSFDMFDRHAQGILNRAVQEYKKLSKKARDELLKLASLTDPDAVGRGVLLLIVRYRNELIRLLGSTNLAALVEGAAGVVRRLPTLPVAGSSHPPPSLSPESAARLIERLQDQPLLEREREIYQLPLEEQKYVRSVLSQQPPPVHPISLRQPTGPEQVQFPIIENGVQLLTDKRLVTRRVFDQMDAAAKQKAFTVAHVEAETTLAKMRTLLAENLAEGPSPEKFYERMKREEEGTLFSDGHLEVIFRTNIQTALSDGKMELFSHPLIRGGFPYAAYEATDDDRVRHITWLS